MAGAAAVGGPAVAKGPRSAVRFDLSKDDVVAGRTGGPRPVVLGGDPHTEGRDVLRAQFGAAAAAAVANLGGNVDNSQLRTARKELETAIAQAGATLQQKKQALNGILGQTGPLTKQKLQAFVNAKADITAAEAHLHSLEALSHKLSPLEINKGPLYEARARFDRAAARKQAILGGISKDAKGAPTPTPRQLDDFMKTHGEVVTAHTALKQAERAQSGRPPKIKQPTAADLSKARAELALAQRLVPQYKALADRVYGGFAITTPLAPTIQDKDRKQNSALLSEFLTARASYFARTSPNTPRANKAKEAAAVGVRIAQLGSNPNAKREDLIAARDRLIAALGE